MSKHRQWHITGWPAILLAPIVIPVIALIIICEKLFGLKTTGDLTAVDVASYLQDFLDGGSGEWDWDDFTSIKITNPGLEVIRAQAAAVRVPLDDDGEAKLRELLTQAQALAAAEPPISA
ncbi:MAG TPA: hypothetical protein VNA29_05395 [Sphingomicrobium sp.]|nr:hypothetical protein [Sphingomicrobium sp.]